MDSNLPDDNTQLNNTSTASTVSRTFRPVKLSVLALIFTFAIASAGGLFYLRFNNISKTSDKIPGIYVADVADAVDANAPTGAFDNINTTNLTFWGWACDKDLGTRPTLIHFYYRVLGSNAEYKFLNIENANGTPMSGNDNKANKSFDTPGVLQACGDIMHGFSFPIPSLVKDGKTYEIRAFAINFDSAGVANNNSVLIGTKTYKYEAINGGYVCKRGGPSEIYENGIGDLVVNAYHQNLSNGKVKACTTIKNTSNKTRTLTKVFSSFCPDRSIEPYCNPDNFGGNWGCGANQVAADTSISFAPGETKEYCREIESYMACGLAQWDITMNDFAQYTDSSGNKYFPEGYFGYLYYFGTDNCPAVQCVTNDFVGETTSGWDECNYCVDNNNDGKYDNNPSQTCLQREVVCRQKTYNRLRSVFPSRVSLYPTPTDINKTDETSRILWFNWAYKLDKHQDTYPNEHIISEGTACGNGEVCCIAPNSPTPTPTPRVTPTPTPTPRVTPTPTPVPDPTISCESLEGVVKDNSGVEANLASLPNDFVGTIDLTCTGRSTRKDITKITFTLIKDLNGNVTNQEKIKTGLDITLVSNDSGVKTFRSTATFNITGQGNYKVKSKVCNEDNTCSP